MDALNANLEELQLLCEQLDPLETTHTDLHFLDVDFEQTQEQYDSILKALRDEIDDENRLLNLQKQFEAEVEKIKNVAECAGLGELSDLKNHKLPELLGRRKELQETIDQTTINRKNVNPVSLIHKIDDVLENVKINLTEIIESLEKEKIDALINEAQSKLESLYSNPTEEEIYALHKQLEEMPNKNIKVTELQLKLTNLEDEKKRKDQLKNDFSQNLTEIAGKLKVISEKHAMASNADKRRRRQKRKPKEPIFDDRRQHIEVLKNDISELEQEFLPLIDRLKADLITEKFESHPCDEQRLQTTAVLENLKVFNLAA